MKIGVVGANGFLGSAICRVAHAAGHEVTGVVHARHNRIPGHIRMVPSVSNLAGVDAVILAAGSFRMPARDLETLDERLITDAMDMLPSCRLLYVSSTSVHGKAETVITETSPLDPSDPYGAAKARGEQRVRTHRHWRIVRLTALYGVGMDQALFLPSIIREVKERGTITLHGDGSRRQNYLHVTDAARLMLCALAYPTDAVFLGCDAASYTNRDIASIVATLMPEADIRHQGMDRTASFVMDNSFTRNMLKWSPEVAIQDGIKELAGI